MLLLCIPFISPKRYGPWNKQAGIEERDCCQAPKLMCVKLVDPGIGARQKQVERVCGGGWQGLLLLPTFHTVLLCHILLSSFPVHPAPGLLNAPKGRRPSSSYGSGNEAFLLPLGSLGFGGWQCGIQKTCTTGSRCLFGDFCPTKLVSLALRSSLMSITQPMQGEANSLSVNRGPVKS